MFPLNYCRSVVRESWSHQQLLLFVFCRTQMSVTVFTTASVSDLPDYHCNELACWRHRSLTARSGINCRFTLLYV